MSYNNFIPTVWSANLQREREKAIVAAKLCNREFEGEIKDVGDTVKILGITRPSIFTYTRGTDLNAPEDLADQSTILTVDQADAFNFLVDDLDKRQAKGNFMSAEQSEAGAGLAEKIDQFIYGKYTDAGKTITQASLTSANVISTITAASKALWENNVPQNEEIYLEITPAVHEKLVLARILKDTDNSSLLDTGFVGKIGSFKVYMSNLIYQNAGVHYCIARTKKAISIAEQFAKTEAYRPEKRFADAVKGLQIYGAKVTRPKELVCLALTPAAETAI